LHLDWAFGLRSPNFFWEPSDLDRLIGDLDLYRDSVECLLIRDRRSTHSSANGKSKRKCLVS